MCRKSNFHASLHFTYRAQFLAYGTIIAPFQQLWFSSRAFLSGRRRTMAYRFFIPLLSLFVASTATLAAEPDPVALLKDAREIYEQKGEKWDQGNQVLGTVEYLYGDKERGRQMIATAFSDVKKREQYSDRLSGYADILTAQLTTGLMADARETVRIGNEDRRSDPQDQKAASTAMPMFLAQPKFLAQAIDFFATADDTAAGVRFIDTMPLDDIPDTARMKKIELRLQLVRALLRRAHQAQAESLLSKTLTEYPESKLSSSLPGLWFRLGKPAEADHAFDALIAKDKSNLDAFYRYCEAVEEMAIAEIDTKVSARARSTAAKLENVDAELKKRAARSLSEIYMRLGDFEKAVEAARSSAEPKDGKRELGDSTLIDSLLEIGMYARRAGQIKLSEKCFQEAIGLDPESAEAKKKNPSKPEPSLVDYKAAMYRLAGGDDEAMFRFVDRIDEPGTRLMADIATAIELNARKTGRGRNLLMPFFETE